MCIFHRSVFTYIVDREELPVQCFFSQKSITFIIPYSISNIDEIFLNDNNNFSIKIGGKVIETNKKTINHKTSDKIYEVKINLEDLKDEEIRDVKG